ncbi:MAG: acyltransferase [Bacteroidales bacterium]|nr:acyltransferase [Bacteroidales bacterium]MBN2757706.1 acyltransferase [Bacteroidales bacterium]
MIFGFDNANLMLQQVDKRAIIPILKSGGAQIADECIFKTPLFIDNPKGSYKNLKIGKHVSIGANTYFDLMDEIIIGDYTGVGPGVSFLTHWHVGDVPMKKLFPYKTEKIVIEANCFIGINSTILYGTKLEEFTLIASQTLVNGQYKTGSLVAGNPAEITNKLSEKVIAKLVSKK